ncbi:hypothetical protein [Parapedobacter sp. 2B3]|uniref:hypothetical protein n=1 Tax=Parapedobacter sp. 2B3 TaxID=3342381 RepID=UPI0035B646DA
MAKVLDTTGINAELVDLLKSDLDNVVLISPYIKGTSHIFDALKYRDSKGLFTTIIFRRDELKPDIIDSLRRFSFVNLRDCERLHAKAYYNANRLIMCSANLYDNSLANNFELGIVVDVVLDADLYRDFRQQVDFIYQASSKYKGKSIFSDIFSIKKHAGYCIRTGQKIPFNPEKPFCADAFKSWSKYSNGDFSEKFCHYSGEPSNGQTSFNKPILSKYWKKAKEQFKS